MGKDTRETSELCCSKLKMFLVSLSFVYFAKAFQGSYMKSSVTQIERRFDIPSSLIGVIDGSFEIGNLLIIAFVSYFGDKFHRPRLIATGCLTMAIGSFLTALPHFFQERYQYETTIPQSLSYNSSETVFPCVSNQSEAQDWTTESKAACEKAVSSYMWVYVFIGNMLRGIGETPVMPLGVSYLDDFSREENTAFYLACIQTVGIIGPLFGFLLGSFCAKLYVDIGAVDLETVSINHKDSRWVGAWWLGFLVTGVVMLLAGIPFWFLPRSLPKQGKSGKGKKDKGNDSTVAEQDRFVLEKSEMQLEKPHPVGFSELAKGFLPSLKRLFSNTIFQLLMLVSLFHVNGFVGMFTFKPKFMEQVYGQSPSKAIFLIGVINLPAVAVGIITGGVVMKRFKLGVLGAVRLCISTSILFFLGLIIQYFLHCENAQVAGLTVSYQGEKQVSYQQESLLSQCNVGCSCSLKHWDPVCAYNGITYASPCLAGCQSSTRSGKEMVFHNCTCVNAEWPLPVANSSATLGQCSHRTDCNHMFMYYMAVNMVSAFLVACGATPGSIVFLRSIQPDLKSLALGMQMLILRTGGGIPAPIYFGAMIDRTCLKWGSKKCGGRGACRLYDSDAFRVTFLGLVYGLFSLSYLLWAILYFKLCRQKELALQNQIKGSDLELNGVHKHNKEMDLLPTQSKEELQKDNGVLN